MKYAVRTAKVIAAALGLAAIAAPALAQQGLDEPFQKPFKESLAGKTVAYVPVAMNFDLTEGWYAGMKKELEPYGVKFEIRDPNWNTNAGAQAVTSLISEKPAVMVIHNPDVQTYAKLLQRAENEGIYVIQINMVSNYKSDAYVGADWIQVGESVANDIVQNCGQGTSGKVQIIEGPKTSAASLDQLTGVINIFQKHPEIKVVSDQAGGNWDAAAAHDLAQTVVRANPDLCAIYGFWDVMTDGAAQAVKAQGLAGKVKIYSEGDQSPVACKDFADGLFFKDFTYNDPLQAQQMFDTASMLLQSGLKPGTMHIAHYSPIEVWTKDNVTAADCYQAGKTLP